MTEDQHRKPATEINGLEARIAVIGVGGGGGNAVNTMVAHGLSGVEFIAANTDSQALASSRASKRVQLGLKTTHGLGAGSFAEVGRAAAEESLPEIMEHLSAFDMCFVTAGMGGGTGTGAAPVIAEAARNAGILTVAVVTRPFAFEGLHRMRAAQAGLARLRDSADTVVVIDNQNLFRVADAKTTFADAFSMADNILLAGVGSVTNLISKAGLINLDFADVRSIMQNGGAAVMGTGEASGTDRAQIAAETALTNPLFQDVSISGAKSVLVSLSGGPDMTLYELEEAAERIRQEVDPDANIIVGAVFDEDLVDRLQVSVLATGLQAEVQPLKLVRSA